METASALELTLGSKSHHVRTLNLLQQRTIGSALFNAPILDSKEPEKFDFDAEFDSAARIVFAAISRDDPAEPHAKWLSGVDATYEQLQAAKVAVLKFAGYIKDRPAGAAAAPTQESSASPGE